MEYLNIINIKQNFVANRIALYFVITFLICLMFSCNEGNKVNPDPERVSGTHKIIPLPKRIDFFDNVYQLSESVSILADEEYKIAAEVIANELNEYGINATITSQDNNADIIFITDLSLAAEASVIEIDEANGVRLNVNSESSAFYAAQTLRQYFWTSEYNEPNSTLELQAIKITDVPTNLYRGFHIDVARHFFSKEFIYKLIDQMALYKLNKLQMHLNDDQGWRIPIDKYPDLTNVGAYREFDEYDQWCIAKSANDADYNFNPDFVDGTTYGGFYTKQDLRDIVAYASENFIEVIPEIDMPGHMTAAARAYPWICGGSIDWGSEFSKPMWVWDEQVMQFAKDVWDEVLEIFPSETVHIGADEVEKSFWSESQECIDFMESNGWSHVNMVQSYFVDEISTYLEEKGRKVIAWDDVMVSNNDNIINNVSSNIDIMYWRSYKPESSIYAAQNGNNIILTPWDWFYLSSDNTDENLINMYNFSETSELDPIVIGNKIGYQACVWTEHIPSKAVFEKFVFPRFQAFSEVAWSNGKNFQSFKRRLDIHLKYMDNESINYRTPDFMKN